MKREVLVNDSEVDSPVSKLSNSFATSNTELNEPSEKLSNLFKTSNICNVQSKTRNHVRNKVLKTFADEDGYMGMIFDIFLKINILYF